MTDERRSGASPYFPYNLEMPITRRDLLKRGVAAAVVAAVPRPLFVHLGRAREPVPPIEDPRLKDLAFSALEAARGAGATYADVRLTHDYSRSFNPALSNIYDAEAMTVGVRALVDGYWGFASSAVWSADELARLGREAVHQAKTNAVTGKPRTVLLAPVTAIADSHWNMPVARDPFDVPVDEILDFMGGLAIYARRVNRHVRDIYNPATFVRQEKAYASTVGSYCTQRLYRSDGAFFFNLRKDEKVIGGRIDALSSAGMGWELYTADRIPLARDRSLREEIRRVLDELDEDLTLPLRPIDVGRYDTVFDNASVANLLAETLGRATELDRALGYEANADGTSYIDAPLQMIGTYNAGAPLLSVTGNRTESGGCATVKWDDEGVVPDEFSLVKDGVLTDFQTTRESAGWLKDYYDKSGKPFRSHGCANADSAISPPMQHSPNLVMTPGHEALDFNGFLAGISNGIAIRWLNVNMDFQHLNGLGIGGSTYEVKHGKKTALLNSAGILFRAPEFWKGLLSVGGAASARRLGGTERKGEPPQMTYHSVTAPPAVAKQLALVDPRRRA
jgi:TldD protein